MTDVTRRGFLGLSAFAVVGLGLAGCAPATFASPPLPLPSRAPAHTRPFVTGASCIGVADGDFAAWRGVAVGIAGTWSGDGKPWAFESPDGEYRHWDGDIDFAPQYSFDGTFSWRALADGQYDERLLKDFGRLKAFWARHTGTLYYRFQHEFNGHWYPWSITDDDVPDFIEGWRRFATLFRSVFGVDDRYRIVWSPAAGAESTKIDHVIDAYPGSLYVDVIAIDYYDFFDSSTQEEWDASLYALEDGGSPMGIGAWRQFAEDSGRPMAVSEWGQQYGDNPVFIRGMHAFLDEWRYTGVGSAAGRLVYDCYFNQRLKDDASPATEGDFLLQEDRVDHPGRPLSAAAYRELWAPWSELPTA